VAGAHTDATAHNDAAFLPDAAAPNAPDDDDAAATLIDAAAADSQPNAAAGRLDPLRASLRRFMQRGRALPKRGGALEGRGMSSGP
jgi:hypothetical protein